MSVDSKQMNWRYAKRGRSFCCSVLRLFFLALALGLPISTSFAGPLEKSYVLPRIESAVKYYRDRAFACLRPYEQTFADCDKAAKAIAELERLRTEMQRLRKPLLESREAEANSATINIKNRIATMKAIGIIDEEQLWADFFTSVMKAALLAGDAAVLKRRLFPKDKRAKKQWSLNDLEKEKLEEILAVVAKVSSKANDLKEIGELSNNPGGLTNPSVFDAGSVAELADAGLGAIDLLQLAKRDGWKKTLKRPASRAVILTVIEKAGSFLLKMQKVERAKWRRTHVLATDAESRLIDKQLDRLKEINEQLEHIERLDEMSEKTIDTLRKCLKRFCPRASVPKITLAPVPKTKFGLAIPVLIKRLDKSLVQLNEFARGTIVLRKPSVDKPSAKKPVVKKQEAGPKLVNRSAEIDAEVRKLRGEIRIATKEYRRIVDGISSKKSKDTKADFERLRTIKSETGIKYGRVKTLLLEKARLGKPQPRSVSIKFSTRSPKKCHAGQVCSHEVTVTNEGDALYAIAIPIIYQMSISLPALIAEADGLACAIDDRNITYLGDEIDIENGGEFTVPLKIGLSSGMRSQAFEGCARFPDLGQLRSGELTRDGVRLLQLALIRTGIDLDSVDGDFGPATQNAVDVYAEVLGLPTQKGVSTEIIEALFPAPLFAGVRYG